MKTTTKKTSVRTSEIADKYFLGAPEFNRKHFASYVREFHAMYFSETQCTYLSEAQFALLQCDYLEGGGDPLFAGCLAYVNHDGADEPDR